MNNIKIKYRDLLASWKVIEKILRSEAPFNLQYLLNKNISSVNKTISELEKERISLFSQYKGKLEDPDFKEKMDGYYNLNVTLFQIQNTLQFFKPTEYLTL